MQDIHDIRPPVQVGFDPMILKIVLLVLAGLLIIALIFFLIKKMWKKKQQPKNLKLLPATLPPCEAALKQLDNLTGISLINLRIFYFDLTAILRNYIGRTFNVNATEMTSQEFIKNLKTLDIDILIKKDISSFVNLSDSFKYAGTVPLKDQVEQDLLLIKDLIQKIEKKIKDLKKEQKYESEQKLKSKPKSKLNLKTDLKTDIKPGFKQDKTLRKSKQKLNKGREK